MSTNPDPPVDPAAPADPAAPLLIGDEVAKPVGEALDAAEALTHAGVKLPFSAARLALDKLRLAADALEQTLRKAGRK